MSSINLYKIEEAKTDSFKKALTEKLTLQNEVITYTDEKRGVSFDFVLYTKCEKTKKTIKWNWILNAFGMTSITLDASPQAVLLAQNKSGPLYAITYGHAFFLVDKYCDRDFSHSILNTIQKNGPDGADT